jgi:hypothetical protein
VITEIIIPRKKQTATTITDAKASRLWRPPIAEATSDTMTAGRMSRRGCQARPIRAMKIANEAR